MSNFEKVEIGNATLYCGDAHSLIAELKFDCIVTDPPYGVGKDYGVESCDSLPDFQSAVKLIAAAGKPTASFAPVCRVCDLPVRPQWIGVWTKTWGASGLLAYPIFPHWEAICFYNLKGDYKGNKGHRSDVFNFAPVRPEIDGHPTPKPIDLMTELVQFMPGPRVCDPFMGSGTTGIAALKLGRPFIGIEINQHYFDIACERIKREYDQIKMF